MNDPYTLTTDRGAEPELGHQSDTPWRRGRDIAPELDGIWTGAFAMGAPNSRIVRRSNALLDWAYGRTFRYSENMSVGSSVVAPVAAALGTAANAAVLGLGSRYFDKLPRGLVERVAAQAGHRARASGPARTGHYRVETYTTTTQRRALPGDDGAAGRPRVQGDVGVVRRVRAGARASTATSSPTCAACSHPRRPWATRCWPGCPPPG